MKLSALLTALTLALTSLTLTGCPDDPVQPGTISASYTLFPQSCGDMRLAQIRAQARKADGSIENETTVPCADSGTIDIEALPGTYTVVVDGLSDEPTPRATHSARQEGVRVPEGGTVSTNQLTLTQKPGSVHVRWIFSNALSCIDNSVADVEVKLLDTGNNEIGEPQSVTCLNSFIDPEDQAEKSGVLFEEVQIQDQTTFNVTVSGFEAAGGAATLRGLVLDETLAAGERKTITVTLEPVTP